MEKIIIPGAEPFFLPAGKTGCVLVHGFTGTPKEMRLMGDFLQQHDITALGVRLAGHGTDIADMARTNWQDWFASVEDGLQTLRGCCDTVFIAGLSMGGLLALLAATIHPLYGAIAMSTPFEMKPDWRLKFARLLSMIIPSINKEESDTKDSETARTHIDYPAYPIRSVAELLDLIDAVHSNLSSIKIPVLMVNSQSDGTVPAGQQQRYAEKLGAIEFNSIMLEQSGHVVTEDVEREIVFQRTLDFIEKHQQAA